MNMLTIDAYRDIFTHFLEKCHKDHDPQNLYGPIDYIMGLGGKRIRPVLTLMACDLFGSNVQRALPAAMAVEVFHNFSLVHDDIMDDAPLRRGKQTVHEKWDINTAILSGDAMLIEAYQWFESYGGTILKNLLQLFSKTAKEVCEGQQYDIDFETRNDVLIEEYLKMIEYKTSVLIAAALQMGAIIGGANEQNQKLIYEFGRNLGIAFQLQDDYLDAFGDPKTFGKQAGGDIIENKKTLLYLKALELGSGEAKKSLSDFYSKQPENASIKVESVKAIFLQTGASMAVQDEIKKYTDSAFASLARIDAPADSKQIFKAFGEDLMKRKS